MTGSFLRFAVVIVSAACIAGCTPRAEFALRDGAAAANTAAAVNINTASVAELEALPGIGRKTAEAIIEYRERHGPFRRTEHLLAVRGISESRYIEIQNLITK